MDKIIKTQITTKQLSIKYKTTKREKFKKMFKTFINKNNDD